LLEPSRTNSNTYSSDFTQTYWTKQNSITVSSNQTTSPEGIVNADKLVSANATSEQYLDNTSISTSSGDDITVSCFVKKLDYDYFHIRFTGVGGVFTAASVWYNIDNGTLGTVESGITAKIEDYGNGWYRCSATRTATGTGNGKIRLQLASSDNSANVVGDGTKGTFIYGAQWEVGSSATSLIDTSGSTVTRSADAPSGAGSNDLINSSEGVLYAEIGALEDDLTFRVLSVSDGSNDNTVKFGYRSDSNRIYAEVRSGSSSQAFLSYDVSDITDFHKVAVKYKVNDFALWVDGVERATDTSGSVSIGLNTARFDNGGGANDFYGKVKVLAVFKEALTDAELTTLTS